MSEIINGVSHVDADELEAILQDPEKKNVYVVDVRQPEEYEAGHIPGVPLVPMGEIPNCIERFDKDAEYVFVCRSGSRSYDVARYFQMAGIPKVHNYLGGMLAWDKGITAGPERIVRDFSMKAITR